MICVLCVLRVVFRYEGRPVSLPLVAFSFLFMLVSLTAVVLFFCRSRLHCGGTSLIHVGRGAKVVCPVRCDVALLFSVLHWGVCPYGRLYPRVLLCLICRLVTDFMVHRF